MKISKTIVTTTTLDIPRDKIVQLVQDYILRETGEQVLAVNLKDNLEEYQTAYDEYEASFAGMRYVKQETVLE